MDGPEDAESVLVLAHGAGAPMDSPWMNLVAAGLAREGVRTARFEFPYMERVRRTGTRRPPDPRPVLLGRFREAAGEVRARSPGRGLFVGGKSMGGRMASMVADELGARGLVCLGFPFHAPGREPGARILHLAGLATPALVVQGTRDPFGTPGEVASYDLAPGTRVLWVEGGDHDLAPPARSGRALEDALARACAEIRQFMSEASPKRSSSRAPTTLPQAR